MDDLIASLEVLGLSTLPALWVEQIVRSEFQEFPDYPEDYSGPTNGDYLLEVLADILLSCEKGLLDLTEKAGKDWRTLANHVQPKDILVLLGSYLYNGIKNAHVESSRCIAILAARIYFKLIRLPDQVLYNIYHEQLFSRALTCFTFVPKLFEARDVSTRMSVLITYLDLYVSDLQETMLSLCLRIDTDDFSEILSGLVDVNLCASAFKYYESTKVTRIISVIHDVINAAFQHPDCNIKAAVTKTFHCFFLKLSTMDNKNGNNLVCESYKKHIEYLVQAHGEVVVTELLCLLQNLAFNLEGFDRQERRSLRVIAIVMFFTHLPSEKKQSYLNWVCKLVKTYRVGHRQIAIEIFSNILMNPVEQIIPPDNVPAEPSPQPPLPSIYDNPQPSTSRDPVSFVVESSASTVDNVNNVEGDNIQITYDILLNAIVKTVRDSSPAIRARAISILGEVMASPNQNTKAAVDKLHASEPTPISLAMLMICDERANVRRASISLTQKILVNYRQVVTDAHIQKLIKSCRDICCTVRSAAIVLIYNLCETEGDFELYMLGPMHQIRDHDAKVQEVVAKHVELLVLRPLDNCESMKSNIPWLFIAALLRHSMRGQLLKAFELLQSRNRLNNVKDIVTKLISHLRSKKTPRDHALYSLVILVALATYVPQFDVKFLINYYYKIAENPEDFDARHIGAVIELLLIWYKQLLRTERDKLRTHLINSLESGIWDFEGSRELCCLLITELNPNDNEWAKRLSKKYEDLIANGASIDKWVAYADICQVMKITPNKVIVQLLMDSFTLTDATSWDGCYVVALARLAATSRDLASCVNLVFSRMLSTKNAPLSVRINALHAIADMASNHPGLLEPHLNMMSRSLTSTSPPLLRRTISETITDLLVSGFIKLKRPMIYSYWLLMYDEDEAVSNPVDYYFKKCLEDKQIFNIFLQCVQDLNKYTTMGPKQRVSEELRQRLYDSMLSRLNSKQKWLLYARFAEDVFEKGARYIDVKAEDNGISTALKDVVIDSVNIFLGPMKELIHGTDDNNDTITTGDGEILTTSAQKSSMINKLKLVGIERLVSSTIDFFVGLNGTQSPLVAPLLSLIQGLIKEYKTEIIQMSEVDVDFEIRLKEFFTSIGQDIPFRNHVRNSTISSSTATVAVADDADAASTPPVQRTSRGGGGGHRRSYRRRGRSSR